MFELADLTGGFAGDSQLGSDYVDGRLGTVLSLAQASTGARQVLTVIVQLFWSTPDSLIMIEEPEISLHPEAQVTLAKLFAEVIAEGKQLIITTHSSFLLQALSEPVQAGKLKPDQVAIYDVTKTPKGTQAKRLEMTREGYIKGWVPSFAKVESRILKQRIKDLPAA